MSWLFSSDNSNQDQNQEAHHNTRSSRQPLLPPLGTTQSRPSSPLPTQSETERPASPYGPLRAAGVGRGHLRPPSTPQIVGQQFFFPSIDIESTVSKVEGDIFPIVTEQDFEDIEAEEMAMSADAQAVLAAARALTAALPSLSSKKKPDLPAFDKRNVEVWIKRVEAAFTRANVVTAKDKFAFLESKFPVDYNAKINEFLFGEASDERWAEFIDYLKKEYGQTKRQQASVILSSFPRNGIRPSQHLASLIEKTSLLTLDDIRKEIIFKGLPSDVRHSIVDKLDNMTAAETAELADKYFDREGKPLSSTSASVNAIEKDDPPGLIDTDDEDAEINAVGKYKGIGRRFGDFKNAGQKPRVPNSGSSNSHSRSNNSSNNNTTKIWKT